MSGKISGMNDFAFHSGGSCFVRLIGVYEGYAEDIRALDSRLFGSCAYTRMTGFEQISDRGEILRLQRASQAFGEAQPAYRKAMENYRRSVQSVNSTIENNLAVSLMFWYEKYLKPLADRSGGNNKKLVCSGRIGYKEYLFCAMAYFMGIDVLLLLPGGEPKLSPVLLSLSQKVTAGESSRADIPEFHPEKNVSALQPDLGNANRSAPVQNESSPKLKIPPHSQRAVQRTVQSVGASSYTAASSVSQGAVPAQTRQSFVAPAKPLQTGQSGSVPKLKIPPHPQRAQQGSVRSVGASSYTAASRPSQGGIPVQTVPKPVSPAQTQRRSASQAKPVQRSMFPENRRREELNYEQLAALAESVVMIAVCDMSGRIVSSGSGIVINPNGYILTNFHVVKDGGSFFVRLENSDKAYPASQVIKYHTDFDMAVIRIDQKLRYLPIYSMNHELVRGQKVVAIGSPMGLFNSVSDGIIAGFRRVGEKDMIQFTAAISEGSSGGALLNTYGEVIGMSTATISHAQNMNLAVSYKQILPFIRPFL